MGGLAVFALIGLYLFITYRVVKAIKSKNGKWLAIVILALIPTADAIVGRIYLQHLCVTEGGLKVYRVAQGVEGFMSDASDDDTALRFGYNFSEGRPLNDRVIRYSKDTGEAVKEINVLPKSKYRVILSRSWGKNIYPRSTVAVETYPGGEKLAADIQIGFAGGWAERFLAGFSGGGSNVVWCDYRDLMVRKKEIVLSTLRR